MPENNKIVSMNILIVDDNPSNIFSLEALIKDEFDFNIYTALSAKEAIKILIANKIDLILSDIQMPEIDGFEFANYIKGIETLKNIPLIFLTAIYDKSEYKSKGYELGAIDYITKPIEEKILRLKLTKYFEIFQAQNSLEEENRHIKQLLNTPNVSYILTDPNIEGNPVVFVNDYFYKFTGYFKEEVIGKSLKILQVDNSDEEERKKIKQALIDKVSITVILKNKKKSDEVFYNKISISPIFFPNSDKVQFFLAIQNDVTDIVKEKRYFETVLNTSQAIILVTDGKNLERINKRFFDLFDFKNFDDFKSKHKCVCELFINKENKNYLQPKVNGMDWNDYIVSNSEVIHEACMIDKNGNERIFQVESSGKIFKGEDGKDEEVITFTDITQLIGHKKMLIDQSKFVAMGEMINMIAHQWRQPLTTLTLILDKIYLFNQLKQLDSEKLNTQYEKSIKLIQYMSKTINDFRNFFQDNAIKEKISIKDLINQSYELILPALNKEFISSEITIAEDCKNLVLQLNPSKISQVFLNLYKNSLDEFKVKGIKNPYLETKCYRNNQYLTIEIKDNAGGIPDSIINKIFEPYFSTKSKNGTGIGLYMSKIIIEQQFKGYIQVSNENGGACFKIMLPFNSIL